MRACLLISMIVATGLPATTAPGQTPFRADGSLTEFDTTTSIEAGVADADPLARGLRMLQADFQTPSGFDRVFHVPTREDLLMRASGGLYAVFPRSVYAQTRVGPVPVVPDNTIFYIGSESLPIASSALRSITEASDRRRVKPRLELRERPLAPDGQPPLATPERVAPSATTPPATTDEPAPAPRPSAGDAIVQDPDYRALRLRTLLRRAARAAQAARGPSSSPSK